jgi:hypothetical protein
LNYKGEKMRLTIELNSITDINFLGALLHHHFKHYDIAVSFKPELNVTLNNYFALLDDEELKQIKVIYSGILLNSYKIEYRDVEIYYYEGHLIEKFNNRYSQITESSLFMPRF